MTPYSKRTKCMEGQFWIRIATEKMHLGLAKHLFFSENRIWSNFCFVAVSNILTYAVTKDRTYIHVLGKSTKQPGVYDEDKKYATGNHHGIFSSNHTLWFFASFVVTQFFAAKSDQYAEEDHSKPEEPRHVWISRNSWNHSIFSMVMYAWLSKKKSSVPPNLTVLSKLESVIFWAVNVIVLMVLITSADQNRLHLAQVHLVRNN